MNITAISANSHEALTKFSTCYVLVIEGNNHISHKERIKEMDFKGKNLKAEGWQGRT